MLIKKKHWECIALLVMMLPTTLWALDSETRGKELEAVQLEQALGRFTGMTGEHVSDDPVSVLKPLASQGNAEAVLWLGRLYRDGLGGTTKDIGKAFGYFEQAASGKYGYPEAQFELGRAYFYGEGTDRNLIAAYIWTSLSLQKSTPVEASARKQKAQIQALLSDAQLRSAEVLVEQVSHLYLGAALSRQ